MSSAAPQWDLSTLLSEGRASGCTALEVRVEWKHGHGLERGTQAAWSSARQQAADAGLVISAIALGTRLNRTTPDERAAAVEEIAAYAELAAIAGASVLRVFGGPMAPGWTMEQARPFVADTLAAAAQRCAPYQVMPCLETHDAFWNPADVAWCLEHAGHANTGATWHAAHHVRRGISVDGPDGRPAQSGPARAQGSRLSVPLGAGTDGTYAVIWTVIAADTHPSRGMLTFSVGHASPLRAPGLGGADVGLVSPVGFVLQALGRFFHFAGFALGFGAATYALFVARDPLPLRLAGGVARGVPGRVRRRGVDRRSAVAVAVDVRGLQDAR